MFSVMLAKSMPANSDTITNLTKRGYFFDMKLDGVRCVMAVNNGKVTLTNRNQVDITHRYPDLVEAAIARFGSDARLILDGEAVVFINDDECKCGKTHSKPSFKATSQRDRQTKPAAIAARAKSLKATFVAFDLLYTGEGDLRNEKWSKRKEALDQIMEHYPAHPYLIGNVGSYDGNAMLNMVRTHALEGLVAKDPNSIYQAGRREGWQKIKPTTTVSCVVVGVEDGTGARGASFGALQLALIDENGKVVPCGKVGTGFKQADLDEICDMTSGYVCSAGGVTDLLRTFVVEVEFQEFTVDGALRFPVFRGIRSDIMPEECLLSQVQEQVINEAPSLV